jgi:V/A-type H+-transporting ATPase subunit E
LKHEEWYEKYLEKTLLQVSEEGYEELIIKTSPDDINKVKSLISKLRLRGLKVSKEPVDIIGGIMAETPDGSVRLDYSLDLLLKMNEHRLMSTASKALFSG